MDKYTEDPSPKEKSMTHCDPIIDHKPYCVLHSLQGEKRLDPLHHNQIGYIPCAFHLLPHNGLAKVAAVMRCGERKGRPDSGWKSVPVNEHINHAIYHLLSYLNGCRDDTHLANAGCRVLMALELDRLEGLAQPVYNPQGEDD